MVYELPVRLKVEGVDFIEIFGLCAAHHAVGKESTGKAEAYPSPRN